MALPSEFFGQNVVFAKDQPEYLPLPAFLDKQIPLTVTCWKLSPEELEEVQKTGKVYIVIHSAIMQPMNVEGKNPLVPTASQS